MPVLRESCTTLVVWLLLIVLAVVSGLVVGNVTTEPELKRALYTASLTLTYGALLGGLAKAILDDLDRRRQQRAEHVEFLSTCLTELKAVYDRAERARVLLRAHKSAATFGSEVRDLIDARTRLLHVARAIRVNSMMPTAASTRLETSIDEMHNYLSGIVADILNHLRKFLNFNAGTRRL